MSGGDDGGKEDVSAADDDSDDLGKEDVSGADEVSNHGKRDLTHSPITCTNIPTCSLIHPSKYSPIKKNKDTHIFYIQPVFSNKYFAPSPAFQHIFLICKHPSPCLNVHFNSDDRMFQWRDSISETVF